jgi:hypothetical protein
MEGKKGRRDLERKTVSEVYIKYLGKDLSF